MSEIGRENPWYYGRLPEYLWLALIVEFYDRKKGLGKCCFIIKKLRDLAPEMFSPKFSSILKLDNEKQTNFYDFILEYIDIDVLSPLTIVFTYSEHQCFASKFISGLPVDERVKRFNSILKQTSDHQSYLSTDIRFLVLYFGLLSGKLHVLKEHGDLILEYPRSTAYPDYQRTGSVFSAAGATQKKSLLLVSTAQPQKVKKRAHSSKKPTTRTLRNSSYVVQTNLICQALSFSILA